MTDPTAKRTPELRFDGFGININEDYRPRIATFINRINGTGEKYGPLFAAAPETAAERDRLKEINAELVEALKFAHEYHHMQINRATGAFPSQLIDSIDKALAKAHTMTDMKGI